MKLSLRGLSKSYGWIRQPALVDVNLEIPAGQIVAIVGANGAGKTTLLRLLSTLAVPTHGEILFDGELLRRDRVDLRKRLYFMPDVPPVAAGMSVAQHLGMVLRLYDADQPGIEKIVLTMLEEFDLLPLVEQSLGRLSRGELYKAALTGLMAVNPELWLIDEPFASGMDPRGIKTFEKYADAAAECGRTIVFTTQILELAERFSTSVCVLNHGRLHWHGAMEELPQSTDGDSSLHQIFADLYEGNP